MCSFINKVWKKGIDSSIRFYLPKNVKSNERSAKCMTCSKFCFLVVSLISLILWVLLNAGCLETSTVQNSETVTDQYGYFKTNFTLDQFDSEANITADQLAYYNRFWAPNDCIKQDNVESVFSTLQTSE